MLGHGILIAYIYHTIKDMIMPAKGNKGRPAHKRNRDPALIGAPHTHVKTNSQANVKSPAGAGNQNPTVKSGY